MCREGIFLLSADKLISMLHYFHPFFHSESVNTFLKYPAKMSVPVSSNNKLDPFVSNPENLMVPNPKYKHFSAVARRQLENF